MSALVGSVGTPMRERVGPDEERLEALLVEMQRFGRPRLSMVDGSGWYCCLELNINAVGAQMKVASEFHHATPRAAASECMTRIESAVRSLSNTPERSR